uniref:Uncharacterized protein n=1 Tax=Tanacetum cinerariifolium TaxID=118510 RepID=A0A699QFV2_TANCI|nr:hypothetical protein [Tanacetum cinerariifolium]
MLLSAGRGRTHLCRMPSAQLLFTFFCDVSSLCPPPNCPGGQLARLPGRPLPRAGSAHANARRLSPTRPHAAAWGRAAAPCVPARRRNILPARGQRHVSRGHRYRGGPAGAACRMVRHGAASYAGWGTPYYDLRALYATARAPGGRHV